MLLAEDHQGAVDLVPALVGGDGEDDLADHVAEERPLDRNSLSEAVRRHRRKVLPRQAYDPEARFLAGDHDPLRILGFHPDLGIRQEPHDVEQPPRRQSYRARLAHLGFAGRPDTDFEIGRRELQPLLGRLDQDVGENRNGALFLDDPLHTLQLTQQIFLGRHEVHNASNKYDRLLFLRVREGILALAGAVGGAEICRSLRRQAPAWRGFARRGLWAGGAPYVDRVRAKIVPQAVSRRSAPVCGSVTPTTRAGPP